jgi:uncharacterized protein YtpQ (UPF0354 family)
MIDLKNILPVIHNPHLVKNTNSTDDKLEIKTITIPKEHEPITKSLTDDLFIFYGIPTDNTLELIKKSDLPIDYDIEEINKAAIINLEKRIGDNIGYQSIVPNLIFVKAEAVFVLSVILLDYVWPQFENVLNDKLVISMPTKEVLFVSGENNSNGRARHIEFTKGFFYNSEKKLSNKIYKFSNMNLDLLLTV